MLGAVSNERPPPAATEAWADKSIKKRQKSSDYLDAAETVPLSAASKQHNIGACFVFRALFLIHLFFINRSI